MHQRGLVYFMEEQSKGQQQRRGFLAKRETVTHIGDLKIIVIYSNVKLPEQSNCGFYLGLESFEFKLPTQPEEGILFNRKSVFTELHIIHNKWFEARISVLC